MVHLETLLGPGRSGHGETPGRFHSRPLAPQARSSHPWNKVSSLCYPSGQKDQNRCWMHLPHVGWPSAVRCVFQLAGYTAHLQTELHKSPRSGTERGVAQCWNYAALRRGRPQWEREPLGPKHHRTTWESPEGGCLPLQRWGFVDDVHVTSCDLKEEKRKPFFSLFEF